MKKLVILLVVMACAAAFYFLVVKPRMEAAEPVAEPPQEVLIPAPVPEVSEPEPVPRPAPTPEPEPVKPVIHSEVKKAKPVARTGPLVCKPWVATDGLGRELPGAEECGPPRDGKFVGIFYFLWLGGHEQGGPYNISEIMKQPEAKREWGKKNLFHWWGEPRFGYYLMDDAWVIAKHAQMLADAGVDVVIFDVTNATTYKKHYLKLCEVFRDIRTKGGKTPQISFLFNSNHVKATTEVFNDFYKPGLYPELWFQWKGKPLLMTNPEGQPQEILDFFSIRRSWAWSKLPPQHDWFGDGKDKWPWIDKTPQAYGWHESPEQPEQMAVAAASHPINSIGRSHKDGKQPPPEKQDPMVGTYFQEQWDHALEVDPEFIFITGWNEWVAQRFIYDGKKPRQFADGTIDPGTTWFIDQYSIEYSRDCEPMRGGFEDNYYYQMASNIRKFKGVEPLPKCSGKSNITVDGDLSDWETVVPEFTDDVGDTRHRNHPGYAAAGPYVNEWGRNDFVQCKVARDSANLYFMAQTTSPLVLKENDPGWMNLLIRFAGRDFPDWEGFHFRVVPEAAGDGKASLCAWRDGKWKKMKEIPFARGDGFVELAFPLGDAEQSLEVEFKWFDHMPEPLDVLDFQDHGDTAPNNRFRYGIRMECFKQERGHSCPRFITRSIRLTPYQPARYCFGVWFIVFLKQRVK